MATLGDTTVTSLNVLNTTTTNKISAPTSDGGSTFGLGSNGQLLKTNGTTIYWGAIKKTDLPSLTASDVSALPANTTYLESIVSTSGDKSWTLTNSLNTSWLIPKDGHKVSFKDSSGNNIFTVSSFNDVVIKEGSNIIITEGTNGTAVISADFTNNLAPAYSASSTYSLGAKVIYNGQLYKCTTAISTAEAWNSAHWTAIKVSNGFVDLDSTQTISGAKTFDTSGSINTNVTISGGFGGQSGYESDAIGGLMLTGAASGMYGKATLLLAHASASSSASSPVKVYLPNETGTVALKNIDNNFSAKQTFFTGIGIDNDTSSQYPLNIEKSATFKLKATAAVATNYNTEYDLQNNYLILKHVSSSADSYLQFPQGKGSVSGSTITYATLATTDDITNAYWANVKVSTSSSTSTSPTFGTATIGSLGYAQIYAYENSNSTNSAVIKVISGSTTARALYIQPYGSAGSASNTGSVIIGGAVESSPNNDYKLRVVGNTAASSLTLINVDGSMNWSAKATMSYDTTNECIKFTF